MLLYATYQMFCLKTKSSDSNFAFLIDEYHFTLVFQDSRLLSFQW